MDIKQIKQVSVLTPKGAIKLYPPVKTIVDEMLENVELVPSMTGHGGEFLSTDGTNLEWTSVVPGSVAGSDTQIQFNDGGAFGASANLIWSNDTLTIYGTDNDVNISEGSIIINTEEDPFTHTFLRINTPDTHEHVHAPFTIGAIDAFNNGPTFIYPNRVWWWGVNASGASTAINPDAALWQDIIETSWVSGDVPFYERHNVFKMPGKDPIRLTSYTIQHPNEYYGYSGLSLDFYRYANSFTMRGLENEVGSSYTTHDYFSLGFNPNTLTASLGFVATPESSITIQGATSLPYTFIYLDAASTPGQIKSLNLRNWSQLYMLADEDNSGLAGIRLDNVTDAGHAFMVSLMAPNLLNTTEAFCRVGKTVNAGDHGIISFYKSATAALNRFYFGINGSYINFLSDGRVGLGTTAPHASAKFEVSSTTGGFLPPRMTTTERDAISSPAAGLMIYNTTDNKFQGRTNSTWVDLH